MSSWMPRPASALRATSVSFWALLGVLGCASGSSGASAPGPDLSRVPLGLDVGATDTVYPGKPDFKNNYTSNVIVVAERGQAHQDGCSGVLIAPDRVLTSAHCVCVKRAATVSDRASLAKRLEKTFPSPGRDAASTQLIEGWKRRTLDDTRSILDTSLCTQQVQVTVISFIGSTRRFLPSEYTAVNVLPHPLFLGLANEQDEGLFREADLALIQLGKSVTEGFRPIQWPDREVFVGQEIVMVGYGLGETEYLSASPSPYRHYGDSRVTQIERFASGNTRFSTSDQDPLGHEFSRNYEGDSGGGVFSKVDDTVLVGIVSARRDRQGGVFESIYPHLQWLKEGVSGL